MMDQSEIEPDSRKQIPTLVWLFLGAVLLAVFAVVVILLGRPSPVMGPAPNAAAAAAVQEPVRTPAPTKLN